MSPQLRELSAEILNRLSGYSAPFIGTMAVLHFLVEDCNVPDDRCVVAGHGEYEPVASNDSKTDKGRNRRVEIVVHGARKS